MESSPLDYSKQRLNAFLREIDRLKELEFPYPHSKFALVQIEENFRRQLAHLAQITTDTLPAVANAACSATLDALFTYLPLLGFIVRSTNVRNAFELYGPLLASAQTLLGKDTKLIISSEWDYSPYTYLGVPLLKDYVLIGLPAPESANPLLVPLAGHELGHSVWRASKVAKAMPAKLTAGIVDYIKANSTEFKQFFPGIEVSELASNLFANHAVAPAWFWAGAQVEETFCDLIGLRLFGDAFFHAFAFLLSPNLRAERPPGYPPIKRRANALCTAALRFGVDPPKDYEGLFEELPTQDPQDRARAFLVAAADSAAESAIDELIDGADLEIPPVLRASSGMDRVKKIVQDFAGHVIPARNASCLSDIIRAAWYVAHQRDLWIDKPSLADRDKHALLRELVLKSIEVLHYHQIVSQKP